MNTVENVQLGLHVKVNQPYEVALELVKTALKAEGFGVLTEIDVKETLKKKLGVDFQRYIILGACNPPLAHRALSADLDVGLLLPCNVVVYETGANSSMVSLVDPLVMAGMFKDATFEAIAIEAQERFKRIAAVLSA
ncbi:MAG: DUF302 domain-containing protein [Chloroflexi bacterium]|nr:DUF302 domain-containing protein [Chloroflexota bacterium]MCL5276042.1 DUF302 domain-containing protein [Chloroflexota bacterium]